jgi:hypothetical protein
MCGASLFLHLAIDNAVEVDGEGSHGLTVVHRPLTHWSTYEQTLDSSRYALDRDS